MCDCVVLHTCRGWQMSAICRHFHVGFRCILCILEIKLLSCLQRCRCSLPHSFVVSDEIMCHSSSRLRLGGTPVCTLHVSFGGCWPAAIYFSQDGDSFQVYRHTEPPCRGTEGEAASDYEGCFWTRQRECAQ